MSVILTVRLEGDPRKLEEFAAANREQMQRIVESAKSHGVIAHRFYGSDGQIMVIDEWPDEQSFQSFFEATRDQIGPMFQAADAPGEPQVTVWRKLETGDDVGWEN